MRKRFNLEKIYAELIAAGIPVHGVRNGEPPIDFMDEATAEQRQQAEAIMAAHDPDTLLPEEQAKQDDLDEMRPERIAAILALIEDDLEVLPTATNAELRQILRDVLVIERRIIRFMRHQRQPTD